MTRSVAGSENRTERQDETDAFVAGPRDFDAHDRRGRGMEPRRDSIRFLKITQIDVAPLGRDFARIDKKRHVDELPCHPTVLSRQEDSIAITEAP